MKYQAEFNSYKFIIEEDYPEVGAYLYVYENGNCVKDYLQNDVEKLKQIAFRDYNLPLEVWKPKYD